MADYGPKSNEEIEFEREHGRIERDDDRPAAPDELTAEEQAVWTRVVNAMGPGWFGAETHDLLKDYCRAVVSSECLAHPVQVALDTIRLDPLNPVAAENLRKLAAIRNNETRTAVSIATKLRITNQATRTADQSRGKPKDERKPIWEDY